MTKLKPKCLEGTQSPALTSTGIILPCCCPIYFHFVTALL